MILYAILSAIVLLSASCAQVPSVLKPGYYAPYSPEEQPSRAEPLRETWFECTINVREPTRRLFTEDAVLIHAGGAEPIYVPYGKETSHQYATIVKVGIPDIRQYQVRMRNDGNANCKRIQ